MTFGKGSAMGFNRSVSIGDRPPANVLMARMVGIGMNFAAQGEADADIESTLVHASALGLDQGDLRALSILTTWLGVHHRYVNADRLVRFLAQHPSERVRAYWSAIGRWLERDRRLARLGRPSRRGPPLDLLPVGTDFQIRRHGEDERFVGSRLRVPKGTLRDRPQDVVSPEVLVRRHLGYRNHVLMGSSWRSDASTALERNPGVSIADIARQASCSFATAWEAALDFRLLRGSAPPDGEAQRR